MHLDIATVPMDKPSAPRRPLLFALFGVMLALVCGCTPPSTAQPLATGDPSFEMLNAFRAANGVPALAHVGELDLKAQAQAQHMADSGAISHSDLKSGVSPGWHLLGENVGCGASVEAVQQLLEQSPPHRANMLEARFNQAGIGVVEKNGTVYVVQFFVQR